MNPISISPKEFQHLIGRVAKIAEDYLSDLDSRPISPTGSGPEIDRVFRASFPEKGIRAQALQGLNDVVRYSRVQNGRFFGYVLGSGDPAAAVADLLCSVLNQNVTAWRSGPAAVTIERTVIDWLAQALGLPGFSGTLTGGGSSANLMGLAIAREARAQANETGLKPGKPLAVYASAEVHMSIPKAVALLGIGRCNLRVIPVDESFRMMPEKLELAIHQDEAAGIIPLAVVASAGTVNTGAIDPLRTVTRIARKHGAWLHVDGAYGALAAIAAPEKFLGLELADSISLDPHKWLYQPLDCGCLLYRDAAATRKAFAYSGDYARSLATDPTEGFSFFEESVELSRRFRALKLWFSLRYHCLESFRNSIKKDLTQARRLQTLISAQTCLQLMAPVELSAVCFRYMGAAGEPDSKLDRINSAILQSVIRRGRIYLSNATLDSKFCLRACIVNHRTTDSDIDCVVQEVLDVAQELDLA